MPPCDNDRTAVAANACITIDVEDWFHSYNLLGRISAQDWPHLELRVEGSTMRILEILEKENVCATFFVLGWIAERCPQLVRTIAGAGHEIASHGYMHEPVYALGREAFRADVTRSRHLLEDLTGQRVRGYRAPCFSITDWAIPILQEVGYQYDSSAVPAVAHDRYGRLSDAGGEGPIYSPLPGFTEACISCLKIGRRGLPWGGGGYFRLAPFGLWMQGVKAILGANQPYIFYAHPWEFDPGQPVVEGIGAVNRFRQRVNLGRCEKRFTALVAALGGLVPLGELCDGWQAVRRAEEAGGRVH